jgi:hypothetical protein
MKINNQVLLKTILETEMQMFEVTPRFGRRYRESILFRPLFLKTIRAMPATAAATVAPGNEIEFGKYAVFAFFVVMHTFNQVSAPAREGILFFQGNKLVEFFKTIRTEAVIKRVGEKGFGFIAQCNGRTGAC